jgi:acetate---CoA ligase (ADP-forming)
VTAAAPTNGRPLDAFFAPKTVAVVGMSADDEKFGGVLRQRLLGSDLDAVISISRQPRDLPGVVNCRRFADLDLSPDLTVLTVPGELVLPNLVAAADIGCQNFVICSAGFAEEGGSGSLAQDELVALARDRDLRVLGPNCLGFANVVGNIWAGVVRRPVRQSSRQGGIALITQTGSVGLGLFSAHVEEFSFFVSTGNEGVLDFGALASYFVEHPAVRVVMGVAESLRNPAAIAAAGRACVELGKAFVVLKAGRSQAGAESALLHTAAVAGDAAAYDALFAENGIISVRSTEELMGVAALADRYGTGRRRALAVVTASGGSAVLAADYCEEAGVELPPPDDAARDDIAEALGTQRGRIHNPLDVTGINAFRPGVMDRALRAMDQPGQVGWILIPLGGTLGGTAERRAAEIIEASRALTTPVLPVWQHDLFDEAGYRLLQAADLWLFRSLGLAISCAAALSAPGHPRAARSTIADGRGTTFLTESASKKLLAEAGIAMNSGTECRDESAAVVAADLIGEPVVIKASHPLLVHKAAAGAIRVGIASAVAVASAYADVCRHASAVVREAVTCVLVEPWVPVEVEFLLGARRQRDLGTVSVLGLGGRLAEAYHDTAVVLEPVTADKVQAALARTRLGDYLSTRPAAQADGIVAGLTDALRRLVNVLAVRPDVLAVDVNPFALTASGQLIGLDASVELGADHDR